MSKVEVKRGIKRKREAKEEGVPQKLRTKLHHAIKEVKKASRRVKSFETQKIVKKLKDARKGNDEKNVQNLESQLECIKTIDCEYIGIQALRSKLRKDHDLRNNADCRAAVTEVLPSLQDDAADSHPQHAVVKARLLSSKVLAQEIGDVIHSLSVVLGLEGKENVREMSEVSDARSIGASVNEDRKKGGTNTKQKRTGNEGGEEDITGSGSEDGEGMEEGWTGFEDESGDEDNEGANKDKMDDDLEDEDEAVEAIEWESGTVDDPDEEIEDPSDDENSLSGDAMASVSSDGPGPSKKARSTVKSKRRAGESTFLPSLSVGFVKGSDSEWSDAEADLADIPKRKNRRGQRARKAIWEKKYGKNANHLKKQREAEMQKAIARSYSGRGRGGPRRGGGGGGRVRGGLPSQNSAYSAGRSGGAGQDRGDRQQKIDSHFQRPGQRDTHPNEQANNRLGSSRRPTQNPPEEKPLHPSWEAKRRLKAKQSPAILPSQGTRMKFD